MGVQKKYLYIKFNHLSLDESSTDIMALPLINWPWSKQIKVKCNDGSIKFYYKNIDDIYPLESRDQKNQIEMAANYAAQLEAKMSVATSSQLVGIFGVFDEANRNFLWDLRAAYGTYQDDPCGMADWHKLRTEEIIKSQKELRKLLIQSQIEMKKLLHSQDMVRSTEMKTILEDLKKGLAVISQSSKDEAILSAVSTEKQKIDELVKKWVGKTQ